MGVHADDVALAVWKALEETCPTRTNIVTDADGPEWVNRDGRQWFECEGKDGFRVFRVSIQVVDEFSEDQRLDLQFSYSHPSGIADVAIAYLTSDGTFTVECDACGKNFHGLRAAPSQCPKCGAPVVLE